MVLHLIYLPDLVTVFSDKLENCAKEFGIVRVWLGPVPVVILVKPSYIEALLSSQVHLDKSFLPYSFTHSWLGQGLLTSTGAKWHSRRKLLTPAFHFKILEEFVPIFNEQSEILVKKIESVKDCDDLFQLITLCTLDIICATAMGRNIGAQFNEDSQYVSAITQATRGIFRRAICPWYYPTFIYNLSIPGRKYNHDVDILKKFTAKIIKARREEHRQRKFNEPNDNNEDVTFGGKRKLAFLDLLLEYSGDGQTLNDDDIQEEVDTFMFEGHDTTTAGVFWTLYLLGLNLEVQEKVHNELDSIFENSNRHVRLDDFSKLKYLELVCKEALRVIPSVPIIARNLKEDLNVGDYVIPAGVQCCIAPMITHHMEEYFPNPVKFDPDRFLPENCKGRHPFAYIPFSAGPRNCIGQKFAMMEEKVLLSHILRKFKVTTEKLPEGIVPLTPEIISRPNSKARITMQRRIKC